MSRGEFGKELECRDKFFALTMMGEKYVGKGTKLSATFVDREVYD